MPAQAAYIHGLAQKHTLGKMEGEGGGGGVGGGGLCINRC